MCPSCEVMIRGGQLSVLYELDKKIFFENLYNFCTNMYLT